MNNKSLCSLHKVALSKLTPKPWAEGSEPLKEKLAHILRSR